MHVRSRTAYDVLYGVLVYPDRLPHTTTRRRGAKKNKQNRVRQKRRRNNSVIGQNPPKETWV